MLPTATILQGKPEPVAKYKFVCEKKNTEHQTAPQESTEVLGSF